MLFVFMVILIPVLDQVTKALVIRYLPLYESVQIIPWLLNFTHLRNPGAAFGILANRRYLFIGIAVLLLVIAFLYRRRIMAEPAAVQVALGLGLGGAVGNLIDRLVSGSVTDFIQLPVIPVFNVADMAITSAVALLFFHSIAVQKQPRVHTVAEPTGEESIEH